MIGAQIPGSLDYTFLTTVPVAKSVILAGPKAVSLYDPSPAQAWELGCNFYLQEEKLGTERAAAVLDQLTELNSYVRISCLGGELTAEALSNFQVCTVLLENLCIPM